MLTNFEVISIITHFIATLELKDKIVYNNGRTYLERNISFFYKL